MKNFEFLKKNLFPILTEDKIVVDLGAGKGHFSQLFDSTQYIPVDFYPYENVIVITDFIYRLPFQSKSVDFIILSNVMEHLKEPEILLDNCFRILKPGGMIFITVPFIIKIHQQPYDFLRYTQFMLKYLLIKTGFVDIKIEQIGNIYDIYKLLSKTYFRKMRENIAASKIINKFLSKIYFRILKKIHNLSFELLRNKFIVNNEQNLENNMDYPQGYGIIAKKN